MEISKYNINRVCVSIYTHKDGYRTINREAMVWSYKTKYSKGITITYMEDTKLVCIPYTYFITPAKSVDEKISLLRIKICPKD